MNLKTAETCQPKIKVLNKEQMWSIHAAALKILATTGFEMRHRGARKMLLNAGCSISQNGRIRMPAYLAEEALNTAPRCIQLYDQSGRKAMDVADGNCFYGTGSDTIFTLDLNSGKRRRTTIEDTASFARLVDGLDNIDFAMSMSNPEDVPIDEIYVHVFAEMIKQTNKPIILWSRNRPMCLVKLMPFSILPGK